jgi:transcriptional regulator of acetoin/glycerol metabolism
VRELANALERAMVVSRGGDGRLRPEHLPIVATTHPARNGNSPRSLAEVERDHIDHILRETNWNISRTAMILGVDRSTVYNKIKLHDLKKA